MTNHNTSNPLQAPAIQGTGSGEGRNEPSKYDEIVIDVLKHLTTLNTGLLLILSAFSNQLAPVLKSNLDYATRFVNTFYLSLLLCMLGFVVTVICLNLKA